MVLIPYSTSMALIPYPHFLVPPLTIKYLSCNTHGAWPFLKYINFLECDKLIALNLVSNEHLLTILI